MTSLSFLRQALEIARPRAVAAALLALLTLAVYWPLTEAGFINLDDPAYVTANERVLGGISAEGIRWAFGTPEGGNYWHPLTWLSHMLDVSLFGTDAGAHHAVSLLIHVANALLLFLLFTQLTGATWRSALVAALFAVHPQHVESVAWVAERKDVLSTFFGLLALLAYTRQLRSPGSGRWALTAGCLALSLMSKPMLVTLPFVFLLLDYWPLGRLAPGSHRRDPPAVPTGSLVREKLPFLILAAAAGAVTVGAQGHGRVILTLGEAGAGERLANALQSYGTYLWKTVWPSGLSVYYPFEGGGTHHAAILLASGAAIAAATAVSIRLRRRHPYVAVGWLWYLGMLVPALGLIQVGSHARGDRYTYLPLVGIFLIVAQGVSALSRRASVRAAAAAAILLPLAISARVQVGHWRDDLTLFGHALEVDPENTVALKNYGYALASLGRVEEGEALMRQAHGKNPSLKAELFLKTALLREREGKIEEAEAYFREAQRLDPGNRRIQGEAERLRRAHPERTAGAAADTRPSYHDTAPVRTASEAFSRGNALAAARRHAEAVEAYREAVRLQPEFPEAWNNLGGAYGDLGLRAEAIAAFREALRLRPGFREARENLERALAAPPDRQ